MQQRKPLKPPILQPTNTHQTNLSKNHTFKLILISMATLFSFTILLLLLSSATSATSGHRHRHLQSSVVQNVCKASRDSISCQSSLSQFSPSTVTDAIESAISVSLTNLQKGRVLVQSVLSQFKGDKNGTEAANNCLELLRYSEYRINLVKNSAFPNNSLKDARAWMSSALVYQYDSWSALKYVNSTSLVGKTMLFLNSSLIASTSNALGMLMNVDVFGDKFELWGVPKTERDGFWERGTGSDEAVIGGVPEGLKVDVTVCKQGCDYMSVQAGVDAAPENLEGGKRFVIGIKAGVYEETVRVPLEKRNLVFLGDGIGKTVITASANVGMQGMTTYNTATVGVIGDGFMASGLTIQNTAGPVAHQAVAFRSDSDLSIVENCEFLGNQDTLYAHSLRQYYKSCQIQGNVDFIFGNSAAFFQDCQILIVPRQLNPEKGETNAVTAHGRIDPGQMTGFVFQNCVINGTDAYMALYYSKPKAHKNFLGRPWKLYSRTVFIKCVLEALISPGGWLPWTGDLGLSTLYYGEFQNSGAGSNATARVPWSSQIPAEHVESYSVQNFIQGNQWIRNSN